MPNNRLFFLKPLLWVFLWVTVVCAIIKFTSITTPSDWKVVFAANILLFLIAAIGINKQLVMVKSSNPYAMVRGVMLAMIMKFFVLGSAAFIYLYSAGDNRSVNALFISMAVYLIYTWVEVKIAMQLKPPVKNGGN